MYKEIFQKIESALMANYQLSKEEFDEEFDSFKNLTYSEKTDNEYFDILKFIPFYAGFKAETVWKKYELLNNYFPDYKTVASYTKEKVDLMMNDKEMIKNIKKINSTIKNARRFERLVEQYGSIHNYFESFKPNESAENLMMLKSSLQYNFSYLGEITVYHFMTEIGLNVIKPDRVLQRIFARLDLITEREQLFESILIGRKFAEETGYPIRYIDVIFVVYGQIGKYGICFEENPKCELCLLTDRCNYYKKT